MVGERRDNERIIHEGVVLLSKEKIVVLNNNHVKVAIGLRDSAEVLTSIIKVVA